MCVSPAPSSPLRFPPSMEEGSSTQSPSLLGLSWSYGLHTLGVCSPRIRTLELEPEWSALRSDGVSWNLVRPLCALKGLDIFLSSSGRGWYKRSMTGSSPPGFGSCSTVAPTCTHSCHVTHFEVFTRTKPVWVPCP